MISRVKKHYKNTAVFEVLCIDEIELDKFDYAELETFYLIKIQYIIRKYCSAWNLKIHIKIEYDMVW